MGLVALIVVVIVLLVVIEMFKHHFTKSLMKYAVVALVVFLSLLILSAFVDLGNFFSKDNTFSKTGHVVAEDVAEDAKKIDFSEWKILDTISEGTKDLIRKILDG